mmetsp:Transcript_56457/g.165053  ORF Transcript_56457/g.165053 Transcript_56457/m.165053 type:complete len:88 (+) Transcript_56457:1044-1307(+)
MVPKILLQEVHAEGRCNWVRVGVPGQTFADGWFTEGNACHAAKQHSLNQQCHLDALRDTGDWFSAWTGLKATSCFEGLPAAWCLSPT